MRYITISNTLLYIHLFSLFILSTNKIKKEEREREKYREREREK
jgi:hypothetical protein